VAPCSRPFRTIALRQDLLAIAANPQLEGSWPVASHRSADALPVDTEVADRSCPTVRSPQTIGLGVEKTLQLAIGDFEEVDHG
jgi:hypothetical protein